MQSPLLSSHLQSAPKTTSPMPQFGKNWFRLVQIALNLLNQIGFFFSKIAVRASLSKCIWQTAPVLKSHPFLVPS